MSMTAPHEHDTATRSKPTTVLNWALALGTVLGAIAVEIYAYVRVLGMAACSDEACPNLGPGEVGYSIIVYGAPVVAVIAIALSVVTANRRRGILVPLAAWAILVVFAIVLTVTFSR